MDSREKYQKYVNTSYVESVEPIVIESAENATYHDENGNSYLDCFAGISVVNAGHCNKVVVEAARRQMEKLIHCCSYIYHNKPLGDLAEKIAQIAPGKLQKSFFGNGGAEAIEGAIRLAKRFTEKYEMISLTGSFHGRTVGGLSITGNSGRKKQGGPFLPGVTFIPHPYCYRCPFRQKGPDTCGLLCAEFMNDAILYQTAGDPALFIAEPLMGEGGLIVPPENYFKTIKSILEHHEMLFIADEVQTGFCRTGHMFAIEPYEVEPDIIVMAKGIANGFPLSCFIAGDEIANSFKPGDHLSTFGGNPVSCAAALANIRFLIENNMAQQANEKGDLFQKLLANTKPKTVSIGEIRGKGLMIGIELVKDASSKEPATKEAANIRTVLRKEGLLVGAGGVFGNVLRIQPPLTITEEELEKAAGLIQKTLQQ